MHCSRCGARLTPNTAFCSACGTPVSVEMAGAQVAKRPWIITLLAVLQLIGATTWLLTMAAYAVDASQNPRAPGTGFVALLLGALGVAQLFCGIGLLKLKAHGRSLVLAWIGLIGIPIGTIVSILTLVYLYKPGIKALFSGKEISEFSAEELAQVAAVIQSSAVSTVLVVAVVGIVVAAMIVWILAAIIFAVPALLRMSGH
jgi:zinc ribbon protein